MIRCPELVTSEWDPVKAKLDSNQHLYITNTFLNTKIVLEDQPENSKIDTAEIQDKLQDKMPKNNRNVNMKSSTYNNEEQRDIKDPKGTISQ
jgi:hypothetical protein